MPYAANIKKEAKSHLDKLVSYPQFKDGNLSKAKKRHYIKLVCYEYASKGDYKICRTLKQAMTKLS